jgi:hypothetical protein
VRPAAKKSAFHSKKEIPIQRKKTENLFYHSKSGANPKDSIHSLFPVS